MATTFTPSHRGGSGAPLVLLHGFTDTWRTWEPILPTLEQHFDVFAPSLPGHAGGPALPDEPTADVLVDLLEGVLDEASIGSAHLVGNSLGGYAALHLAARGRAESVTALAPAGGWAADDQSYLATLDQFVMLKGMLAGALEHVDALVASPEGRRQATQLITVNYEHLSPELIAHQVVGVTACDAVEPLVEYARREGWSLDAAAITCPVRVVWGTNDLILPAGVADVRFRTDWLPNAEWIDLEDVGHCIQLDVPEQAAQLILEHAGG
ncbi:MAG: alpha/beta hydrolase [Patulibacter minatonensis]